MSRTKRRVAEVFSAFLAVVLAGGMAAAAHAADAPDAAATGSVTQAATPQIDELDEIWVRGKRLSVIIEEAEDDFFELYNTLSKGNEYDVYCGRMALNSGSMIMVRSCVPGFIVNSSYDYRTGTVRISQYDFGQPSCSYTATYFEGYSAGGIACGSNYSTPVNATPPSGLIMMSRRPAYAQNVLKVVTSDSRLLEMVGRLGRLYDEMDAEQQRYVQLKQARKPVRPPRDTPRRHTGPRG